MASSYRIASNEDRCPKLHNYKCKLFVKIASLNFTITNVNLFEPGEQMRKKRSILAYLSCHVEYCSQFHQYFTTSFFVPIFFCKKLQSQTFIGGKLGKTILYKKAASKMLVKLTPCLYKSLCYKK